MTHQPMDPVILDQMYDHPERFGHLSKDEYIRLLIEDIRFYRAQAEGRERALQETEDNARVWGTAFLRVDHNGPGPAYTAVDMSRVTITVAPRPSR